MIERLPAREREILDILYRLGQATAVEIGAEMTNEPSNSAVRSLLRRLEERRLVAHRAVAGGFVYAPTLGESQIKRSALSSLVRSFFDGSPVNAATALLGLSDDPTPEEVAALERKVAELRRKVGP